MRKFWMVMQKEMNRPLQTKYYTYWEAAKVAAKKCGRNKKPYYVIEAIMVCDVVENPVKWTTLEEEKVEE